MQTQESVINSSANKICRPALLMRPLRQLCIAERIFKQYVIFIIINQHTVPKKLDFTGKIALLDITFIHAKSNFGIQLKICEKKVPLRLCCLNKTRCTDSRDQPSLRLLIPLPKQRSRRSSYVKVITQIYKVHKILLFSLTGNSQYFLTA